MTRHFPQHATLSQPGVDFSVLGCHMVQIYLTLHPLGEPSLTTPAWTMPPSEGQLLPSVTLYHGHLLFALFLLEL